MPNLPPADPAKGVRLNKRLAELGLCSRREADEWIERGLVRVNGETARMGQPVQPSDHIEVEKTASFEQSERVTIIMNKPMGYVSSQAEDGHEPAIVLISEATRWKDAPGPQKGAKRFERWHLKNLAVAGRLDIDSVGMLVMTQDGRVARTLIGEDSDTEKEYLVRVAYGDVQKDVRAVLPEGAIALLQFGISLDGQALKPAKVSWQNEEQLRIVLREGKKRQIRRMCEAVNLKVVGLKRIRMGRISLGELPVGQWRYLMPFERF